MGNMVEDLVGKFLTKEISGASKYNVRNEKEQTRPRIKKIARLEHSLRKWAKLLMPMEIAIPLNPFTGVEDDEFNENRKFRPLFSATTAALVVKTLAHSNELFKNALMTRAGMQSWDTSDSENLTEDDKKVLFAYRVPRIFSTRVANIKDKRVTGKEFGVDYVVDVKRDELGNYVGEDPYPLFLKVNKFYREIAYEKSQHYREMREKAQKGLNWQAEFKGNLDDFAGYNIASMTDDDFNSKILGEKIFAKNLVSEDYPSNSVILYEMELNSAMEIPDAKQILTLKPEDMDAAMRMSRLTKELRTAIDNYKPGGKWFKRDTNWDFLEIDMTCMSEYEGNQPKRDIPKGTRYEFALNPLKDQSFYDSLVQVVRDAQNDMEALEERFMASSYIKKLDSGIESRLADVVLENNDIESGNPFVTKEVILQNADFISEIFGDKGDLLVTGTEFGMTDAPEGTLDPKAAAEASKVNIEAMLREGEDSEQAEDDDDANVDGDQVAAGATSENTQTSNPAVMDLPE